MVFSLNKVAILNLQIGAVYSKFLTKKFRNFEDSIEFVPSLALIYSRINDLPDNVRLAASLQLKHATDKQWKPRGGLSDEQKTSVKNYILGTIVQETNSAIAAQVALICAKIIRKDGNGSWADLFILLVKCLSDDEGSLSSKCFCALTLKDLIKMMKSKRLPKDRKAFREIALQLWPVAAELYQNMTKKLEVKIRDTMLYGIKIWLSVNSSCLSTYLRTVGLYTLHTGDYHKVGQLGSYKVGQVDAY